MAFKHLLAKSTKNSDEPAYAATLEGHTRNVLEAAEVLNSLLLKSLSGFLPKKVTSEMWSNALFCASWLHDIGKANDHFQTILRDKRFRQGIRHESLGIIIIDTLLGDWLYDFWKKYPEWYKAAWSGSNRHMAGYGDCLHRPYCFGFVAEHKKRYLCLAIARSRDFYF
jgi:CRISPR-associated endonuclease Cas3-HD